MTPDFSGSSNVVLLDVMGDDLSVVNAARQTAGTQSARLTQWGETFIHRLMEKRHGTPFEAPIFHFQISTPIRVAREWFRHRIGSYNEFSLRVGSPDMLFYLPAHRACRREVARYEFETMDVDSAVELCGLFEQAYGDAVDHHRRLLQAGAAKELAAYILPMGLYTTFQWVVNARALMNFISLRTASDAMHEIREAAVKVERVFKEKMPVTHQAFAAHGKVGP